MPVGFRGGGVGVGHAVHGEYVGGAFDDEHDRSSGAGRWVGELLAEPVEDLSFVVDGGFWGVEPARLRAAGQVSGGERDDAVVFVGDGEHEAVAEAVEQVPGSAVDEAEAGGGDVVGVEADVSQVLGEVGPAGGGVAQSPGRVRFGCFADAVPFQVLDGGRRRLELGGEASCGGGVDLIQPLGLVRHRGRPRRWGGGGRRGRGG